MKTTKTDPMIREMKKAYKASPMNKLDALWAKHAFWKRRETIARNKLVEVRSEIDAFCFELANKEMKP